MSHNPSAFCHTMIVRLFPLAKLISNYILRHISTLGLQILLPVPNSKAVLFPSTKKLFWNKAYKELYKELKYCSRGGFIWEEENWRGEVFEPNFKFHHQLPPILDIELGRVGVKNMIKYKMKAFCKSEYSLF